MSACAQRAPEEPPPSRPPGATFAAIGRDYAAFVVPPGRATRVLIEDIWELYGVRRLWAVTTKAHQRVGEVLRTVAVSHRPQLACVDSPAAARQAVIATMQQVGRGDVLMIFEDDVFAAHAWISEGLLAASSDGWKGSVSWTPSL